MKKKILLPIIAVSIIACMGLISCSNNKDVSKDTAVTTESNVDSDEKEKESNSSTDSKDNESKSSTEKDNKNSDVESKKSDAKKESSKKSGSETKADNNSDNNKTQSSENKVMSKTDAVNKILAHEISGSIPKYCIPVKAVGEDYSVLEKSEGSNAFLCNDDNKLDNGVLVELMDFNGGNDSNNFVIRDYNAMKNGGKGLISSGSISNSGEVKSK